MLARLMLSPLDKPIGELIIVNNMRLLDLFPLAEDRESFKEEGTVVLDGEVIPPQRWHTITLKPKKGSVIEFIHVPKGKKTFALLAAVAAVALTAGIAAYGIPFLGAGFAAGSFGANAVAAGVGIAASLAINALTAPPKVSNTGEDKTLSNAGVSGNQPNLFEPLPVIFGEIVYSPPYLSTPFTDWDGDDVYANASVGVQGPCVITDVKVNGIAIENYTKATYEIRYGTPGASARTMDRITKIEERDGITLSNFVTDGNSNKNDQLSNQANPAASSPVWHYFQTAGDWTEFLLRFNFPSGIVRTDSGDGSVVPLRIEIRKKGDPDWRRLPTFHFYDSNKGSGAMRAEIRVKRARPPGGPMFSWVGDEYPISSVNNYTGITKTWAYESDAYFGSGEVFSLQGYGPIMTNYTTSGVTISASSDSVSAAWRASDGPAGGTSTYWQPANNSLPASITYDFGSAVQFGSYLLKSNFSSFGTAPAEAPTEWYVEGSNNGTTWTNLGAINNTEFNQPVGVYQIESPGSYRYYRLTVTANNGASNQQMRIAELRWYTNDAWGSYLGDGGLAGEYGTVHRENTSITNRVKSKYVSLDKRGAVVYLDPASWNEGEYEIRIKRGWSFNYSSFSDTTSYSYSGTGTAYFFDPQQDGNGIWKIYQGQKRYRSDCSIECFQTIDEGELPYDDTGIASISVSIPGIQIQSISAKFSRMAKIYTGGIWKDELVATSNPAAHYRELLLGETHRKPVPGEAIDHTGLATWYDNCVTKGYEVNAVLSGARVGEAKQLIATAGYASITEGELYGVVEDKDTSSDPIRYMVTPANSQDEGNTNELPEMQHAIIAEYNNEDLGYAVDHVTVYMDGYSALNATIFETVNYAGFTNTTKVSARALFDLRQRHLRQTLYQRRVGIEFIGVKRGMPVALADDTIDEAVAIGRIVAVTKSGGNIVSITIDNIATAITGDATEVDDVTALTDVLDTSQTMGVSIRVPGSNIVEKQLSNVSDSNVLTFTTPFADTGVVVPELLVAVGKFGRVVRRCKALYTIPKGYETRTLVLVDEAPELYDA